MRNSYVRSVSIHHTYNRAVAIHGVHYLRVTNNVMFETMGQTLFIEDGVETKNIITHNLAANTRESFALLTVDHTLTLFLALALTLTLTLTPTLALALAPTLALALPLALTLPLSLSLTSEVVGRDSVDLR